MSDLRGGPVPVGGGGGIRTPRDVMRDRNAREARRQEEQKAEEQRRLAEERRRSAERRAGVGAGGARFSQTSSVYTPDVSQQQGAFNSDVRRTGSGRVAGSDALGDPTGRYAAAQGQPQENVSSGVRQRGPSVSQQDQPRPATSSTAPRRTQQASQSVPRAQPAPASAAGSSSQQPSDGAQQQRGGASTFPHAFQRWEDLSSHWEGLTSYWLHKLEANTEEIRNTVPNAVTLNRQITDLSAAGANLFHAVVELQRLRASSERKFQRWFFETRGNDEKNRELQAQTENQLRAERSAREEAAKARADSTIQAENARREVAEMRREMAISKEEARRAWEELGRRNLEALETAQGLKEGRVAVVGGVQVVPYFGGPSRTGSSVRPGTREGQQYSSGSGAGMASAAGAAGLQSPGDEREYYNQEGSPTNTDPFTESGPSQVQPLHNEPKSSLAAGTYQPPYPGQPTSASTAQSSIPMPLTGQRPAPASQGSLGPARAAPSNTVPVTAQEAQRFYQHAPQETFLHSPPGSSSSQQAIAAARTASARTGAAPVNRQDVRSEGSYVESEGEDPDDLGRRLQTNESDDGVYDTEADIRRERELAARYGRTQMGGAQQYGSAIGGGSLLPDAPSPPSVPATSAQAMAGYSPTATNTSTTVGGGRPDYSGTGYGDDYGHVDDDGYGDGSLQATRHHHPTRLSDVLEEEEDRSSRRTGERE